MRSNKLSENITLQAISREKDISEKVDQEPFPEGGTVGWCTVVGGALVMFCNLGYNVSFGVYQDFYTRHYLTNISASSISWIGGINTFLGTALGIFAGMLHDRGYFYHLIIGGSLLQSFALFMLSLCQPGQYYQILLAHGVGTGIALGTLLVPTIAVVSQHFRKRRTLAMILVVLGSSFGAIIHPIMLNYLINGRMGFANAVRISASLISVLLLIACLLMRTGEEPPKCRVNYLAVGRGIVRDVPFCIMSVGLLCFQTGFVFPIFYLQLDSIMHGNSKTFSFYSSVILNGGGLIGRLSAGFIARRIGVPWLMIISTAGSGILVLSMIGLSSVWTVVAFGILYGYFSGIYIVLMAPLMTILTGDLSELGVRMGIGMAFTGIGGLVGGPISGAFLTSQYKWWRPSLFSGLIELVGCSLFVVMQLWLMRDRKRSTKCQEP